MTQQRLHFMGIGGIGMSALASWSRTRGAEVSGCDREESPLLDALRAQEITVQIGHDPAHAQDVDRLVYTSAVAADHPERVAAGTRAVRRGTFLAELMRAYRAVGIAGTHGKTTTTWITAHLLLEAGLDPTVVLGGEVAALGGNLRLGQSDLCVAELDESDGSFLEPALKVAVLTNVEADHLHYYKTFDAVKKAFSSYAAGVEKNGLLIACMSDPEVRAIAEAYKGRILKVGICPHCDLCARDLATVRGVQSFRLIRCGEDLGHFTLPMPGEHNVRNALCALGVALSLGAKPETLRAALATCTGVDRRMTRIGVARGVTVYSDYAHHPTEVRAAIQGARELAEGEVWVAFQPHLYSRTQEHADAFGEALATADKVLPVEIYPAREAPIEGVTSALITMAVRQAGGQAEEPVAVEKLASQVCELVPAGVTLVCMGAGDIGKAAYAVLERLSDAD